MSRYIIRRLLIAIPVLLGITMITFALATTMPGNYVDNLIPPDLRRTVSQEYLQRLREHYGLDKPIVVRYVLWLRELLLHGNLGYSYSTGEPVLQEMLRRLPATLQLTLTAMTFAMVVGVTLGVVSAIRQYSFLDHLLTILSFIWLSTPGFVLALGSLYLFSLKIPLFPTGGRGPLGQNADLLTLIKYMFLPVLVLGLGGVPMYMRYARSSLLDVLRQDYIALARAKGLSEKAIYLRHALRNALLPIVTIAGLSVPGLVGGAYIIESIFVWPGMGSLGIGAIMTRNYPLIMAMNLVTSMLVLFSNLATDILYAWVDPRIRYE